MPILGAVHHVALLTRLHMTQQSHQPWHFLETRRRFVENGHDLRRVTGAVTAGESRHAEFALVHVEAFLAFGAGKVGAHVCAVAEVLDDLVDFGESFTIMRSSVSLL